MRTPSVNTGLLIHRTVVPATLALLAMLLAGCALGPTPGIAPSASACGASAVLYCELSPHGKTCGCVPHSDFRDLVRTMSLR
jgi:hypothetical protein